MNQDQILTVALTMEANPGVYALLLGSGLSTGAGVPTGWGIVRELIGRMATIEGVQPTDLEGWYAQRFGEAPGYTAVLRRVGPTQADRMAILRSFFEPTPDQREAQLKMPTTAHHAIAKLAELGAVRLIITTNFDRLIERALEAHGITPLVIASPDAAQGALPYTHAGAGTCVVLKLHGDYLDTRILNTEDELLAYPDALQGYLARILDDFGLLICGWSADWDTALRDAMLRSPNRRFAAFWLQRGKSEPSDLAKRVMSHLGATMLRIDGAEQFFPRLAEAIESVRESRRPDPRSVGVIVAAAKRFLAEERYYIRLFDLVSDEVGYAADAVSDERLGTAGEFEAETYLARVRAYTGAMERLLATLAVIGFHARDGQAENIARVARRLAKTNTGSGLTVWLNLQTYPALLIAYTVGILSLTTRQYRHLAAVLLTPIRNPYTSSEQPLAQFLVSASVLEGVKYLPGYERRYTPGSDFLAQELGTLLRDYLSEDDFLDAFDRFEFFLSLVHADVDQHHRPAGGSYIWRRRGPMASTSSAPLQDLERDLRAEMSQAGPILGAGFFGGDRERLESALQAHDEWLARARGQLL